MLDNSDTKCLRCKACNTLFSPTWYEDKKAWEDLCWDCLASALDITPDTDDYRNYIDNIDQEQYDE